VYMICSHVDETMKTCLAFIKLSTGNLELTHHAFPCTIKKLGTYISSKDFKYFGCDNYMINIKLGGRK
jgi:hypothetical protein